MLSAKTALIKLLANEVMTITRDVGISSLVIEWTGGDTIEIVDTDKVATIEGEFGGDIFVLDANTPKFVFDSQKGSLIDSLVITSVGATANVSLNSGYASLGGGGATDVSALSLEATQQLVLTELQAINGNTALLVTVNTNLTSIISILNAQSTLLTNIDGNTDGIEGLITTLTTDLNTFATQNSTDLTAINTTLNTQLPLITAAVNTFATQNSIDLGAINTTLTSILNNMDLEVATTTVSSTTTGVGTTPVSAKSVHFYTEGSGATINGIVRPNRWSHTYEFNNDLMQSYAYNGNGAKVYVDYII